MLNFNDGGLVKACLLPLNMFLPTVVLGWCSDVLLTVSRFFQHSFRYAWEIDELKRIYGEVRFL